MLALLKTGKQIIRALGCLRGLMWLLQVIVNARKPDFFNHSMSLYEIVTP